MEAAQECENHLESRWPRGSSELGMRVHLGVGIQQVPGAP